MYTEFAAIYDRLMDDVDYARWAEYYLELLSRSGTEVKEICECGCGTGMMTLALIRKGVRVLPMDISPEMLEMARLRLRKAGCACLPVRADMCAFSVPHAVDAVLCACDGINYLHASGRLSAFFDCAWRALRPGGTLAFDFSTRYKLSTVLGNQLLGEDRDDIAYLWFNQWDEKKSSLLMELTFFVREPNGLYRRVEERQRQSAHEPDALKSLLQNRGFTNIHVYGDRTFDPPEARTERIHITAQRPVHEEDE